MNPELDTLGAWRRYPYEAAAAALRFPDVEGDRGTPSGTYSVSGRLRGRASGREWAFAALFHLGDLWGRVRADFRTLAIFDLASGAYATHTEVDFPRLFRRRRRRRLEAAPDRLDLTFRGDGDGAASTWRTRRDAAGALVPFGYALDLRGRSERGEPMHLALEADARKPPVPLGGEALGGRVVALGSPQQGAYLQSDLAFHGSLEWGEVREDVDGDCGWIERRWAAPSVAPPAGRWLRFRHERLEIHLSDGIEISVWQHHDRRRGDRRAAFAGATAVGTENEVAATTDVRLEPVSFLRDPGRVRPMRPLGRAPRYFTERHRLTVPEWGIELVSEPLVAAPAHRLPIEYWNGPVHFAGRVSGREVSGFGFHERTMAFHRDFELAQVLRTTITGLPPEALAGCEQSASALVALVGHAEGLAAVGDHEAALRFLAERVRPELARVAPPDRGHLGEVLDDLAESLMRWWVRPHSDAAR